eukprot:s1160_g16.t1
MSTMAEGSKDGLVKRFSGESQEAQRDYRRWKRWARAYLNVQKARGVPEEALGSLLFTLLDGTALRAFDAVSMDDIEVTGGQQVIFDTLDERFPEEASHDRIGEVLDNVFDLKVERGEATAVFTGKVRTAFSAAEAEGVKFPDVAKGYLLMRFARLGPEKRAIVLAASRQSYAEADVAAALRTTYPEGLYAGKTSSLVAPVVENDEVYDPAELYTQPEDEVLAMNEVEQNDQELDPIEEQDAIDVLMTWKQTRSQINKEKIARGFGGGAADLKRMEARVRYFKCKKVGHFSRNCPSRKGQGKGGQTPSTTSTSSTRVSYVNMVKDCSDDVEEEVILLMQSWSNRPRDYWRVDGDMVIREHVVPRSHMFCVRWSGCPVPGEDLMDDRTTVMFMADGKKKEIKDKIYQDPCASRRRTHEDWTGQTIFYKRPSAAFLPVEQEVQDIVDVFTMESTINEPTETLSGPFEEPPTDDECDGGGGESTCHLVHPAGFGVVDTGCGRGVIGSDTLTRHEEALRQHGLQVEELETKPHRFRYGNGSADVSHRRVQIPIFIKGREMKMRLHVVPGDVPLLVSKRFLKSLGARVAMDSNEIYMSAIGVTAKMVERDDGSCQLDLLDMTPTPAVRTAEVDAFVVKAENLSRLESKVAVAEHEEDDDEEDQDSPELLKMGAHCVFKGDERRKLLQQIHEVMRVKDDERLTIMEVFSPGRFAEMAAGFGFESMGSFDLSDGWDWRKPIHRRRAEQILAFSPPDVLVMTPPCGPLSRLQSLHALEDRRDPEAFLQEVEMAKGMVRWCLRMAHKQLVLGKHYVFESSDGSKAWSLDEMLDFVRTYNHPQIKVSACAVGLLGKVNKKPFGKKWKFMTSSVSVATMLEPLVCTGDHEHQVVEGSSGGQLRSIQSQVYPKKLVKKILGGFAMQDQVESVCMPLSQATIQSPIKSEGRRRVEQAIRKMHINLGNASVADMLRILQHHRAQPEVLELVKAFSCDICQANRAPKAVKDSAPPRDLAPLRYIGLDVKWLPTWKKDYKIKALNVVCRSSGLQQMYPFREGDHECSELIARLYRQWTRSFGRPKYVKFDAGRCNLGQTFLDCLERDGTTALDIPGEAHEQMGDVEAQGKHFEEMLNKVIQEVGPTNYIEWVECVDCTVEARNMLMKRHGYSAYQLVFGRDPEFPGDDLLSDSPNVIANSAILEDAVAEFANRARSTARQAVLQSMDHRAARIALNSRPRPLRVFQPGDEVAIWRRGRGIKKSSARWRGPGIVAGTAGGNYWGSMPGSFVKCSPEQLRLRTTEEREADRFLVRDLRAAAASLNPEVGFSPHTQKNFTDLTGEERPPGDLLTPGLQQMPDCRMSQQQQPVPMQQDAAPAVALPPPPNQSGSSFSEQMSQLSSEEQERWRQSAIQAGRLDGVPGRSAPTGALQGDPKRPRLDAATLQQSPHFQHPSVFGQQVLGQSFPPSMPAPPRPENVPIQIESSGSSGGQQHGSGSSGASNTESSPESGFISSNVVHADVMVDSTNAAVCLSTAVDDDGEQGDFVLHCEDGEDAVLLAGARGELNLKEPKWKDEHGKAMLIAGIQKEVTNVIVNKQALKPLSLEESRKIRQHAGDRVVPSKLVLTLKCEDTGEEIVKARWTARGDRDPDLFSLVREGKTQAPTISSNGRFTVLQTIASHKFMMELGDVTGAFLEADQIERKNGKLYMSTPSTYPLPGYHPEQLFEVIKPIYGLNDSPQHWFTKFSNTSKSLQWKQSRMDPCVFFLRDQSQLVGVMGVHVDDVVVGGRGPLYNSTLKSLRTAFPFRKWKQFEGQFCGSFLKQDRRTFAIEVSQEEFVDKVPKPKLRTKVEPSMETTQEEVSSLRSCLGGALWLAKETRPDLSVQVSQGQQLMPRPTIAEARIISNIVRRARQYRDMKWTILPIPPEELCLCVHTDAAFGNAKGKGTQAGYIVGVTNRSLQAGAEAPWAPAVWKSYRLKRVVGSTFAGETQVLADGLGHTEWVGCHLAEAFFSDFSLQSRGEFLKRFQIQAIVDCKSIYDHLQQFSSPGSVTDKRVAIDLIIIREALTRVHGVIRWCPTWLQLADALTKENPEAMDVLRGAIAARKYHLHAESTVMEAAADQRQRRLAKRQSPVAQTCAQGSTGVFLLSSDPSTMVKVNVKGISEGEVRALFEVLVTDFTSDDDGYVSHLMQNKATCKAKIPGEIVDAKRFKGEAAYVTCTYCKATGMITITSPAVMLDGAEDMVKAVFSVYAKLVGEGQRDPLPAGAQHWGKAMDYLEKKGFHSVFLEKGEIEDGEGKIVVAEERQAFVPQDEEFTAAVAELCNEIGRKLHNYPLWKKKLLHVMLQDFGANPDQVIELSSLTEHYRLDEQEWTDTEMTPPEPGMIAAKSKSKPVSASEYSLALRQCAAETDGFAWRQIFSTVKVATGAVQLKVESVNVCLDAGQGNNVLAYVCYDKENPNQMWSISGSHLIWEGGPTTSCLHAVEESWFDAIKQPGMKRPKDALRFRSLPERDPLSLAACADKPGQRIQRADAKPDGTFLLRDADTGKCLVATGFCFDSGAGPPILYPCHEPKALRKQRFQIVDPQPAFDQLGDSPGWVQFMRGWDDNGRKRFFERCLDHQPVPPRRAQLMSCHEAQQAKITWRRVNQQEPLEWQLWRENPNTRSRPLGGDMAPPR